MKKVLKYFYNLLISIDQFLNVVFGGDPDETISSRLGKWARGKGCLPRWHPAAWLYWLLNFIDHGHTEKAIDEEEGEDQIGRW